MGHVPKPRSGQVEMSHRSTDHSDGLFTAVKEPAVTPNKPVRDTRLGGTRYLAQLGYIDYLSTHCISPQKSLGLVRLLHAAGLRGL